MPADRAAVQRAANALAAQLNDRSLTGKQRDMIRAKLREYAAILDKFDRQVSHPTAFGAPHIGTDILGPKGGAE